MRKILSLTLCYVLLACGIVSTTGCTSTQVQDTISVAAQVANSAAAIVTPVSPEYGALLSTVGTGLKDLSGLYSNYVSAAAADRPGIAGNIHAALSVISANLTTILADAHVKAPKLVQEIGVAVAVINSALSLVLAHIPASPATANVHARLRAQTGALPVITGANANSAAGLAKEWNERVGQYHPAATVAAPEHKKLGIF